MTTVQKNIGNAQARFNMIEQQIRTWEVLDPHVLQLLHKVPREHFVPEAYQGLAFADIEIPLLNGQFMLSPKLEARILQSLAIKASDKVLHVGTGSGYFTALLANMAAHVYSIEIDTELSATAAYKLAEYDIDNVTIELGNGIEGLKTQQPYDVIVLTGSSPVEPLQLREQLKVGGVLFVVLGSAPVMEATLITRVSESGFNKQIIFETCLPPLEHAPQAATFTF
jgi:protein-L-isoaspartate(D-aspartate) O-methyltransferase